MEADIMRKNFRWGMSVVVFLILFLIFFTQTSILFRKKHTEADMVHSFYSLKENSVDVLSIGSSHAYYGYSPNEMWGCGGMTSYMLGSPAQTVPMSYYLLKEALKYQSPKIVLMETYNFHYSDFYTSEANLRTAFDGVPLFENGKLNQNKVDLIQTALAGESWQKKMTYYIPFSKYHSRWSKLSDRDYFPEKGYYLKGGRITFHTESFGTPPEIELKDGKLADLSLEYFQKIVDLCRKNNIQLVMYATPVACEDEGKYTKLERMNESLRKLLADMDIPFVNCQWVDDIQIDYATDFTDAGHMNYYGQKKTTEYLAEYLKTHYNLEDHRADESYSDWEKDYEKYLQIVEKRENQKQKEEAEGAEE